MCGIIGYAGDKNATPILICGLKALEYRGYDSAGIAVFSKNKIQISKKVGPVDELKRFLDANKNISGNSGIGHTRWATHGIASESNTHPHNDCTKRVFVVHNGIIENYKEIKTHLEQRGHAFQSETDTETIPHLIEELLKQTDDFKTALLNALKIIKGAYALAIIDSKNPEVIYAAKLSSPLVVGIGKNENFLASDPSALIGKTKDFVYLKDNEVAEIRKEGISITNTENKKVPFTTVRLDLRLEKAQKGNYPHFMLKEIFEAPEVVLSAFRGRIKSKDALVKLGGLEQAYDKISNIKRLKIVACGTSYYAGLLGEYLFEEIAEIPTEVHLASEFCYKKEPFEQGTAVIAISQSGETADTLSAVRKAKKQGMLTLGIVNTVGSTIARETDAGVYNHAGPEIGVASTKAFISQITVLALMAVHFSKNKALCSKILCELERIPEKIKTILEQSGKIETIAENYKQYHNFLFLGRQYNYPAALEGALKLKEVSYLHAEGCGAGEMKHGPLAMISLEFPTIAIMPKNRMHQKMHSNLEEIKARNGRIFAISSEDDTSAFGIADDVFCIPPTAEPLEPLLTIIPLQLFAYYIGTKIGLDVDKPRNLAKSVTVE